MWLCSVERIKSRLGGDTVTQLLWDANTTDGGNKRTENYIYILAKSEIKLTDNYIYILAKSEFKLTDNYTYILAKSEFKLTDNYIYILAKSEFKFYKIITEKFDFLLNILCCSFQNIHEKPISFQMISDFSRGRNSEFDYRWNAEMQQSKLKCSKISWSSAK